MAFLQQCDRVLGVAHNQPFRFFRRQWPAEYEHIQFITTFTSQPVEEYFHLLVFASSLLRAACYRRWRLFLGSLLHPDSRCLRLGVVQHKI
jgi:hypothetical protein